MEVGHAHEPAAAQRRLTAGMITEAQLADHGRGADLELVPVAEQFHIGEPDRILALEAQLEHQPVGGSAMTSARPEVAGRRKSVAL